MFRLARFQLASPLKGSEPKFAMNVLRVLKNYLS